jgi:Recombinase
MVMTLFGGLSKGERSRIRTRVRNAMAAQAAADGRFLGGRPPYGYGLADAGPHPNPGQGSPRHPDPPPGAGPDYGAHRRPDLRGVRLRSRLFAIADGLTHDAVPSPSAYDRARNAHRNGQGWSKGAVRAILTNPRYTGVAVWGPSAATRSWSTWKTSRGAPGRCSAGTTRRPGSAPRRGPRAADRAGTLRGRTGTKSRERTHHDPQAPPDAAPLSATRPPSLRAVRPADAGKLNHARPTTAVATRPSTRSHAGAITRRRCTSGRPRSSHRSIDGSRKSSSRVGSKRRPRPRRSPETHFGRGRPRGGRAADPRGL